MRVEEKAFLSAAVAALPRIAEIISDYAPDEQAGALEVAERRFIEAAQDYGCIEIAAQSRVSILMKRLRRQVRDEAQTKSNCALCCEASPSPISSNACKGMASSGADRD